MNNEEFISFYHKMTSVYPGFFSEDEEIENIGIALCLAPIIQPDLLDTVLKQELGAEGDFPLFGGIRGAQYRGIIPTGETWMYFCCGTDADRRIAFINHIPAYLSHPDAYVQIDQSLPGEPFLSGKLSFSHYFKHKFTQESILYENRSLNLALGGFIQSKLSLHDLVLTPHIFDSLEEIKYWQHFRDDAANSDCAFNKRIKPGLKILFHGKAGTGKTQVASILGNQLDKKVYRIDLSQVVSKYIGETEKNLSRVFELAEQRDWILFFDEGDALFGKRTAVNSSNDRYANQEVAYLLQRIEEYSGIIILSTNLKDNIDAAFLRRFQIITEFAMPDQQDRLLIWKKLFAEITSNGISEENYLDIARTELSGGAITNIVNYVLLKSYYHKTGISFALVREGIIRELRKENRLTSL